jgi:hypothetical protein
LDCAANSVRDNQGGVALKTDPAFVVVTAIVDFVKIDAVLRCIFVFAEFEFVATPRENDSGFRLFAAHSSHDGIGFSQATTKPARMPLATESQLAYFPRNGEQNTKQRGARR